MAASLEQELHALYDGFTLLRSFNYVTVASFSFLAYDWCLSISYEVDYIWRSRWSLVKCLYLCARYFGLLYLFFRFFVDSHTNPNSEFCRIYTWLYGFAGPIFFTATVDVILILRIHALYNKNMKVLVFLSVLLFVEIVAAIYSTIDVNLSLPPFNPPIGLPWPGCVVLTFADNITKRTLTVWIPCLTMTSVFFGMTLYKVFQMNRGGEVEISRVRQLPPILKNFVQDGVVFFLLIFTVVLMATLVITSPNDHFSHQSQNMLTLMITTDSFSGSHLVLNLRVASARGHSSSEMSAMKTEIADFVPRRRNAPHPSDIAESSSFDLRAFGGDYCEEEM